MTLTDDEKEAILKSIAIDPHLTNDERYKLSNSVRNEDAFYKSFFGGTLGAGIGYAIAKFLKLSKTSQVIITLAGFGIGKYLLDNSADSGKFIEYNKKLKGYKINS